MQDLIDLVPAEMSEKEMDETVDYEMDDSDLVFVNQTLPAQKLSMKEDRFEQIVDRLEKESFKLVSTSTPMPALCSLLSSPVQHCLRYQMLLLPKIVHNFEHVAIFLGDKF